MTMKSVALLAMLVAVGGGSVLAATGLRPAGRPLPVPRVTDRTKLERRVSAQPKPPARPFPTNGWWSGGALEAWPSPLYAWPLVVDLSADAVTIDAPGTAVAGNSFHAAPNAPIRARFDTKADKAVVSSWGDWDVTFDYKDGAKRLARVTAVQGSPYAWIESDARAVHLDLPPGSAVADVRCDDPCGAARLVTAGDTRYVVATTGTLRQSEGRLTASLPARGAKIVTVGVVAPGAPVDPFLRHAMAVPNGTRVSWNVTRSSVDTTFAYPGETLMGLLPHHRDTLKNRSPKPIGTYKTPRGPITVVEGSSFATRVDAPAIAEDPPLHASLRRDASFLDTLRSEIASQDPAAGDTYNAGKQLLRSALLAELADGTGDAELRKGALAKTSDALSSWCGSKAGGGSYGYDANLGGIVGEPASFGSEHYNDHHFHYGYVIRAAAIVAELDPSWERRHGDCIDLLVRDVAAGRDDASFPFLRHMDPYAGHSWANGLTRFADGQNQESVSEAVLAWHAVASWGDVTGQKDVAERGRWLLAQELQGAKSYWFDAGATKTFPEGFGKPMVSIVWGGKSDYATFFDAAEGAIHGIQFFPAVAAIEGLLEDGVAARLVTPLANRADDGLWTNHLRLVALLANERAPDPGRPLDAFYSESYVRNWLATH